MLCGSFFTFIIISVMSKYSEEISKYLKNNGYEEFCPKAVLFDMDGVLLNSMPNHAVAWQESMAEFGITMTAEDAYATEGMRGVDTIRNMVKEQLGKDIDEAEAQRMYDEKARIFGQMPSAKVMKGVKPLLRKIHKLGLEIAVVTGSGQKPLFRRIVKELGQYITADKIITAYDVKTGKPAPDPYLMGLERTGKLRPWEAIVVENAPLGVRAGAAAKIFTIAVNSGPLPDKVLADEGANLVLDSMSDLCHEWDNLMNAGMNWRKDWNHKWQEVMDYMNKFKRRPSKHRVEDHKMLNWIKYNKKLKSRGKMPADREEKFNRLLTLADKYRKVNQNAYMYSGGEATMF